MVGQVQICWQVVVVGTAIARVGTLVAAETNLREVALAVTAAVRT